MMNKIVLLKVITIKLLKKNQNNKNFKFRKTFIKINLNKFVKFLKIIPKKNLKI